MRCLLCHKEIGTNPSFREIFWEEDVLCYSCRKAWKKEKAVRIIAGCKVETYWAYNDAFQKALIQFKECYDEALKEIFLYPLRNSFPLKYFGYTLLLLPSSEEKLEARGFSHLKEMYSLFQMPMLEPFEMLSNQEQKQQPFKHRLERKEQIRLKANSTLPKKVLLVDDVITTGATMEGAIHALNGMPLKLKCFACANVKKKQLY